MILLYEVVDVLHLVNHDLGFTPRVDRVHGCLIGSALVNRDFFGNPIGLHGFVKEAQGCSLGEPGSC